MDDAVFYSSVALGDPSNDAMALDYMDELLLEGCWLEAVDGSNFFHQTPPCASGGFYDSSYLWPMLEVANDKSSTNPSQKNAQQVRETSELAENSALVSIANGQSLVSVANNSNHFEGSELNKLLWIKPKVNTAASVMERLIKALRYIQDSANGKDLLVQIWVPVNRGSTRILTTVDQPFSVNSSSIQLASYRNISTSYEFAAEEDSCVSVGLPGRVFMGKVPEWSPDVRFFRVDEYPRVPYAQQCDVRGTLALPVFEQASRNCLGVLEVVMTTQKINYRPELESVCRALEVCMLSPLLSDFSDFSSKLEVLLAVKVLLTMIWYEEQHGGGIKIIATHLFNDLSDLAKIIIYIENYICILFSNASSEAS